MSVTEADPKLIERIFDALVEAERLQNGIEAALQSGSFTRELGHSAREMADEIRRQTLFTPSAAQFLRYFAEDLAKAAASERRTVCVQDEYGISPPRIEHDYSEKGSELLAVRSLSLAVLDHVNGVRFQISARRIASELAEDI